MIHPIVYFPFTHLSENAGRAIFSFFETVHCLDTGLSGQNGDEWKKAGHNAVVHHPDEKTMAAAEQQYIEYQGWVHIHKGNERNLKSLLKDTPYFKNDNQVTAIKSRLNATGTTGGISKKATDTDTHRDLLFLKMAESCDAQNEHIDQQLAGVDKSRSRLFTSLKGGDGEISGNVDSGQGQAYDQTHDPGELMTKERILSWTACMAASGFFDRHPDPVFLTTSKAVFEYLESICNSSVNALDINEIKVHENGCKNKMKWQQSVTGILKAALAEKAASEGSLPLIDDACDASGQLKLKLFSGNEINRLFDLSDKQVAVCLVKLI